MEKITAYDFPDTIRVADGYDSKEAIDLTRDNLVFITDKVNELIELVNEIRGNQ